MILTIANRILNSVVPLLLSRIERHSISSWNEQRSNFSCSDNDADGDNRGNTRKSTTATTTISWKMTRITAIWSFGIVCCLTGIYYAISSPPLHWLYETAQPAGPSSVYLPGGGFSGFWFHLGYLHAIERQHDLHNFDYYCYSAGCLSILSLFMNRSLDEVYSAALSSQNAWRSGNQSRFDIVDYFFEELVPPEDDFVKLLSNEYDDDYNNRRRLSGKSFLPNIKILVTSLSEASGIRVIEAANRQELKESIRMTTWVPYLTGWGFAPHLDGGFSRVLHPRCEIEWHLPITWETIVHTFSPGLSRKQVDKLWKKGHSHKFPLPSVRKESKALDAYGDDHDSSCDIDPPKDDSAAVEALNRTHATVPNVLSNADLENDEHRSHT